MQLANFLGETVIYGVGVLGSRAMVFLLIPLYTHCLSTRDYGILSILLLITQILMVCVDLGNRKTFLRFAAEYKATNTLGTLLASSTVLILLSGLLCTLLAVTLLPAFLQEVLQLPNLSQYMLLMCGAAIAQTLTHHYLSYYRITQNSTTFVLFSLGMCVLALGTNFLFLSVLHSGIQGALIAQIITYGISWLILVCAILPEVSFRVSSTLLPQLLTFGSPLILITASDLIADAVAMSFLGRFATLEQVAVYALGYKLAQIVAILLLVPFQLAYEPFVYAHMHNTGIEVTIARLFTYLTLSFTFVSLGLMLIARELLTLVAPPQYASALSVIPLLLPGMLGTGIYYIGESLLHIKQKTHVTSSLVFTSVLVSCTLNWYVIPHWGMYGAICTYTVVNLVLASVIWRLGVQEVPVSLEVKRLGMVGVLFVCFLIAPLMLQEASRLVYCGLLVLVGLVGAIALYLFRFIDATEHSAISRLWEQGVRAVSTFVRQRPESV